MNARAVMLLMSLATCMEPTEIKLQITTDELCSVVTAHGVAVRVGSETGVDTSPSTNITAMSCTEGPNGGDVGTLVVIPSMSPSDSIGITVVLGTDRDPNTCDLQNPQGCIVARRALGYIAHHSLVLPIALESACLGVPCPAGQTCANGTCVSDVVPPSACIGGTCSLGDAGVPDAAPETGACDPTMLQTDPHNCGKCFVDCSGGTCSGGICTLTPTVAASNAVGACIGVSNSRVYFSTGGAGSSSGIYSVPTSGGTPVLVQAAGTGAFGIGALTTSANAFGAADNTVYSLAGTPAALLVQGPYAPVATDGTIVCAGTTAGVQCNGGINPSLVSTPAAPVKMAMTGTVAYMTLAGANGQLVGVSYTATSPLQPIALFGFPMDGVALGPNTTVYAVVGTGIEAIDVTNGTSKSAATGFTSPRGIAYDPAANLLYVADGAGVIDSVQPGGVLNVLAQGQQNPDCIALDTSAVYWLSNGVPMKVAR